MAFYKYHPTSYRHFPYPSDQSSLSLSLSLSTQELPRPTQAVPASPEAQVTIESHEASSISKRVHAHMDGTATRALAVALAGAVPVRRPGRHARPHRAGAPHPRLLLLEAQQLPAGHRRLLRSRWRRVQVAAGRGPRRRRHGR
jgi:hypothetical protein